ncbi:hypothetical protein FRC07_010690 [Ceratobasidium sp. 392]|nr:hypothetical protein FRC07_010690 [Ceratobasidium sp. 392]
MNGSLTLDWLRPVGTANPDTATEPKTSELEMVELQPEDSVSQRVLPTSQPLPTSPIPSRPLPVPTIRAPAPINTTKRANGRRANTNCSDESSQSDLDSNHRTAHASKRPRLAQPAHLCPTPAPSCSLSQPSNPPVALPHPLNSTNAIVAPSTHLASARAAPLIVSNKAPAPVACASSLVPAPNVPRPPSASDPTAVLAWARQQAEKAGNGLPIDFGLLARTLGSLGPHIANTLPQLRRHTRQPPLRAQPSDLVEDDAEVVAAEEALERGVHASRRWQPALSDYTVVPHLVATHTIPKLNAMACVRGIYECYGTICEWIDECYEDVWAAWAPLVPYQKPPCEMKGIIAHCLSLVRGDLRTRVDSKVSVQWGFANPA